MAYRGSTVIRRSSDAPAPPDPMDAANMGYDPVAGGYSDVTGEQDPSLRAAAAREMYAEPTGIPEAGRSWDEMSLAENLIAIPGSTALEGGLETGAARAGELLYGATRIPQTIAEGLGAGEWWQENAPEVREYINERGIKPVFGDRELIDEDYYNNSWQGVKDAWQAGDTATALARAPGMILKEGIGSVPDMVALLTGPLGVSAYSATRTSEIAEGREASGQETNTATDVGIAAATAVGVTLLDRFSLGNIINKTKFGGSIAKAQKHWAKRAAAAAGTEAATEAVQEHLEFVGEMVRDDFSDVLEQATSPEAMEAAIVGAIVGGGVGGGLVAGGDYVQSVLDKKALEAQEGPAADEAAAAQAGIPERYGPPELQGPPAPVVQGPPELQGPPAPAVQSPSDREADISPQNALDLYDEYIAKGADPESDDMKWLREKAGIVQTPEPEDIGSPMELPEGVLDDGQQDAVSPVREPFDMPPEVDPDSVMDDIQTQNIRIKEDAARGRKMRDTGLGQLMDSAVRAKSTSARQVERILKKNLTDAEKLERQEARIKDAKTSAPGPMLLEFFENVARLTSLEAKRSERKSNAAIEARNPKRKNKMDQLVNALNLQTDTFQGLAELISDSVRGTDVSVSGPDALTGAVARNAGVLEGMGFDVRPLLEAKSAKEARAALDTMSKQAKNRVITARSANEDVSLPPRISMDRRIASQVDPKSRDIQGVMAENERRGRTSGKSTVPDMTPEDMYSTVETDEEGNPRTKFRGPRDSEEAIERREAIRARDRAVERQKFGTITNYERPGPQYEDITDEGGNTVLPAQPVKIGEGGNASVVTPAEYAASQDKPRTRAPSSSERIKREQLRKVRKDETKARDLGRRLAVSTERLDAARRAAGEERQRLLTREEERRNAEQSGVEKGSAPENLAETQKNKKEASGTVKKRSKGVSKERAKAAGKVFQKYNRAGRKGSKQKVPAATIAQRAKEAKNQVIPKKGLRTLRVFNPNAENPKKPFVWIRGAYPKRIEVKNKAGKTIRFDRATPHMPGDPAPYNYLESKTYYNPEDIVMVRGTRVYTVSAGVGQGAPQTSYAEVKDPVSQPEEMDSLLNFLITVPFEWEGEPDYLAMAQYLIEKAPKQAPGTRKVKSAEETELDALEEDTNFPDPDSDIVPEEEVEMSDEDLEDLANKLGGMFETSDDDAGAEIETLAQQIEDLERSIQAAKIELPVLEQLARETPVDEGKMSVTPHGAWPLSRFPFDVRLEKDKVTDDIGMLEWGLDPNDSDGSLVAAVMDMAQSQINSAQIQMDALRKKLEEINENRDPSTAESGKKKKRNPASQGPADIPGATVDAEDDTTGASRRTDDDRIPGVERIDPGRRKPVDLYEGIGGKSVLQAAAKQRSNALNVRGDDGSYPLSEEQVVGIGLGFQNWVASIKKEFGAFLNIDATGFGKARQVGGLAKLISDEEAKTGRNRPVAILFPGGASEWSMVNGNPTLSNALGNNIVQDMRALGIDPTAKYSDGTDMYEFRTYKSLQNEKGTTEYAAVLADEAHGVKGTGKQAKGFDAMNTGFRAFFTATPTDMAGQELYYLKHLERRAGETLEQTERRIANRLNLRSITGKKGQSIYRLSGERIVSDVYLKSLNEILGRHVKTGALVSRSYGRISKNYIGDIPPELIDQEAVDMYNDLMANGMDPNGNDARYLVEHMKVPYMIERAKKRVTQDNNKVIAVFTHTNPSTSNRLKGTKYGKPAIERFMSGMRQNEIPAEMLAGEAQSGDAAAIRRFQGTDEEPGPSKVIAISDARGSTGLNLNDKWGSEPRYMMVAMTNFQGESFLQLLGRHDRNNNRSVPYTEWVRANNATDRAIRQRLDDKIELQNTISGMNAAVVMNPEIFAEPINKMEQWNKRTRKSRLIKDVVDLAVADEIMGGKSNAKSLVHTVAMGAKDPDLAALASDLLRINTGWDEVSVRMMRDGESPDAQGLYYSETGEVAISDEAGAAQTLLHEMVHHFTHRALRADDTAWQQLKAIMEAMVRANPKVMDRFENAFTSYDEFLAEAFSDPEFQYELHKTTIGNGKKLSMFQRFLRFVQQLLGVTDDSYNALERIIDLDLFRGNKDMDFDSMPLHQATMPRMMHRKRNQTVKRMEAWAKRAGKSGDVIGALEKARGAMIWTMTYDQIVDTYTDENSEERKSNVLKDMLSTQEAISSQANKNNKEYEAAVIQPLRKFATSTGKNMMTVRMREGGPVEQMTQLEYLSRVMNVSGYVGVHFGKPLTDKANVMAQKNKKGELNRPEAKAAWDVHSKQVNRKEFAEAMKVYNQLASFFEKNQTKKREIIGGAYLDSLYPNALVSWTKRGMKDIRAELKKIGAMTDEDLKNLGASRDAMADLENMLTPGIVPGAYFPLKRYGDYVVVIDGSFEYTSDTERDKILREHPNAKDKDGRIIVKTMARFETAGKAARFKESMQERYKDVGEIEVRDFELAYASEQDMQGATSFSALSKNFDKQLSKVDDAKQRETMRTLFAQAMLDMMPETSAANAMRERQGIDGASLDVTRVLHQYGTSQGYMLANLQFSRDQNRLANEMRVISTELKGAEQRKFEQVRRALMTRNNAAARGPMDLGRVGQKLSDVGFLYYLVGFSYNIVNATQPLMVTTPYLAARYGGKKTGDAMIKAYKAVGGAPTKELIKTRGTLNQFTGMFNTRNNMKDFDKNDLDVLNGKDGILANLTNQNHRDMLKQLENEGHIEASLAMDMSRMSEREHIDENGKIIPPSHWEYLTDWMRTFPHITEVMNRSVTAVAAFDLEFERTKDYDKSVKAARTAVKQTQFVYQNWNKPPAFQNQFGRTALMFKQHVQHMYYYMIRNAYLWMKGASPEERATARKALSYFVGMHVLMAGAVGGTPELVKWIITASFMLFGEDDEPFEYDRWLRNSMYDMFGGEKGMGNVGATLASNGLPGFIGMDLSGRIGIDSMLMFEAPDLSSRDSFLSDTVRIAGGPMVGLAERLPDVKLSIQRGDYYRLVESLSPKVIRDPVRALRYENEGYKDLSGKTYRDSEEVNWYEFGLKALGFSPTAESNTYQSRAVGQTRQRMESKKRNLYARFYSADTQEDRQKVIEDIRNWNKSNPDFAISRSNLIRSMKQRRRQELLTEKGVYTPKTQRGWSREQQRSYTE